LRLQLFDLYTVFITNNGRGALLTHEWSYVHLGFLFWMSVGRTFTLL
jgi:hypothetical protein